MTTTYDPAHPQYFVESDLHAEMTRVYDLCHGCRLCFNLCPSFPTLFDYVDARDGDASQMTPAEQDQVVDECYQCKLCYVKCPYVPPHEWELDFPRLMMRGQAVHHASGHKSVSDRVTDEVLCRTDLVGTISSLAAPIVNADYRQSPEPLSVAMQKTAGIHAQRMLPPYAHERFTTWFKKRHARTIESPKSEASIFPTCFVEYMQPDIAKDLVRVCEHNEIACSLPQGTRCCGAPWLHNGDIKRFEQAARRNVVALAQVVRAGRDIVVSQPTSAYVIKRDYPIYAPGADADLVSERTFDAAEYLMKEHRREGGLRLEFPGTAPGEITYHLACHLRAQNIGARGRELLSLAGAKVNLVERCSGIDGTWGYRAENFDESMKVAVPLMREVRESSADAICGDCHLANTAIYEETGRRPLHPVQVLARAYGLGTDT